jgi:hypothetical protein
MDNKEYTNNKDKKGNEIYVGDTLQVPSNPFIKSSEHIVAKYKGEYVTYNKAFENIETANKNPLDWVLKDLKAVKI